MPLLWLVLLLYLWCCCARVALGRLVWLPLSADRCLQLPPDICPKWIGSGNVTGFVR
jgi:hypothetical protein